MLARMSSTLSTPFPLAPRAFSVQRQAPLAFTGPAPRREHAKVLVEQTSAKPVKCPGASPGQTLNEGCAFRSSYEL